MNKSNLWYHCPKCRKPNYADYQDIERECDCGCKFRITGGWKTPKISNPEFIPADYENKLVKKE